MAIVVGGEIGACASARCVTSGVEGRGGGLRAELVFDAPGGVGAIGKRPGIVWGGRFWPGSKIGGGASPGAVGGRKNGRSAGLPKSLTTFQLGLPSAEDSLLSEKQPFDRSLSRARNTEPSSTRANETELDGVVS